MPAEFVSRRLFLRVRELLSDGVSTAQIAAVVPLPLNTIAGIATQRIQPSRLVIDRDDPQREAMLNARRCPGCGGMVYVWPCLACCLNNPQVASSAEPSPQPKVTRRRRRPPRRTGSAAA